MRRNLIFLRRIPFLHMRIRFTCVHAFLLAAPPYPSLPLRNKERHDPSLQQGCKLPGRELNLGLPRDRRKY